MSEQQDIPDEIPLEQEPVTADIEPAGFHPPEFLSDKNSSVNSFNTEDSFFRARMPKPIHWSVAWSDLMMTMFILFLAMFVYQASHEEFLVSQTPEIVGGSTSDALEILGTNNLIVPIVPITPKDPIISSDTLNKVEKVEIESLDMDDVFRDNVVFVEPEPAPSSDTADTAQPEDTGSAPPPLSPPETDIIEPAPLITETPHVPEIRQANTFSEMYDMSQEALSKSKLDKFASIELVPDKTMRIILTGDLLFFTGQADLSNKARQSLTKLAAVIKRSPYMINVIGHTDNQPMHSSRFASNWELSVVRASSVARFLIEEMEMDPTQFIVSGYGSNRPRRPNTNVMNRSANRRVEIIISKRLAPALKATSENLL